MADKNEVPFGSRGGISLSTKDAKSDLASWPTLDKLDFLQLQIVSVGS